MSMTLNFIKICFKSLKNIHKHASVCKALTLSALVFLMKGGCLIVLLGGSYDASLLVFLVLLVFFYPCFDPAIDSESGLNPLNHSMHAMKFKSPSKLNG